jgi:hypothetical protein
MSALAARFWTFVCVAAAIAGPSRVFACDICAVYTATELQETRTGLRVGIGQQYSHFTTLRLDGDEVSNPDDERLDSSITQLLFGYQIHPRFRVQLNFPLIVRDFRRLTADGTQNGDESGPGDLTLTGSVLAWSWVSEASVVNLSFLAGVKFPTGDSNRLREEEPPDPRDLLNEHLRPFSIDRGGAAHGDGAEGVESGIHGHDLALGSGSFDAIIGGDLIATYDRVYWTTAIQYSIRTRGSFDYEYADELVVNAGPGFFLLAEDDYTFGLGATLLTETKGKDNIDHDILDDTGITSLYAGPALRFTWGPSLSVDLAADLPAIQNNTSLQIVPDFRLRGGVVWRF